MCRSSKTSSRARLSANWCSGIIATEYSAWAYPIRDAGYQRLEASLARPQFTELGGGLERDPIPSYLERKVHVEN